MDRGTSRTGRSNGTPLHGPQHNAHHAGDGIGRPYLNGLNRWSILGACKESGIEGLQFRCVHDDRWAPPDPVWLDGHFEGLYPPDVEDMREAVNIFVERKFGPAGAYDPSTPRAWREARAVK